MHDCEAFLRGVKYSAKHNIDLTLLEANSFCLPTMKKADKEQVLLKDKNCSSWHISEAESKMAQRKACYLQTDASMTGILTHTNSTKLARIFARRASLFTVTIQ